jgi:hypothetical protein
MREAQEMSFTGHRSAEEAELDRIRGPRVANSLEDDPRFGKTAADPEAGVDAANSAGSYESFLQAFGAPPPMPGRGG